VSKISKKTHLPVSSTDTQHDYSITVIADNDGRCSCVVYC